MRNSIRQRLTVTFIGLAVGPLLLVGVVLAWQSFTTQQQQALNLQHEVALRVSAQVRAFFKELENELHLTSQMYGLQDLDWDSQHTILSELLVYQGVFEELTLFDSQGHMQMHVSRLGIASNPTNRARANEFVIPQTSGEIYYSPVRFEKTTGEPLMTIAVSLLDVRTGLIDGVLVSDVRIKKIWDLIANVRLSPGQSVYIVDAQNRVIAHRNPSLVLRGTNFNAPDQDGTQSGLSNAKVVLAVDTVSLGQQEFNIVAEQTVSGALTLAIDMMYVIVAIIVAALVVAGGLGFIVVRQIVRPIESLVTTAQAISGGDPGLQAKSEGLIEVQQLAGAFNRMTAQLNDLIQTLEDRVAARTHRLETVASLSERFNTILKVEPLLTEMVNQVKEQFGYYHTHIYLLDEAGENLVVAEGAGLAGAEMKAAGRQIALSTAASLVAQAARKQQIVRVGNVQETPNRAPNPPLPDVYSEMAVPIVLDEMVVGVLDVQHDHIDGFDEGDEALLRSLANQVAVALRNAQQFEQVVQARAAAEQARVEAEAAKVKAESANRAKSEFLSSMSHELRTPLNGILGYAQILRRDKTLPPLQEDGLDIIQQSGEHLLTLINDILDLSKIEAGKLDFRPTSIQLPTFLESVAGMIRMRAQQKGLGFIYEAMTPLPPGIETDEKRLRQILINLLGNAVKFTGEGQVFFRVSMVNSRSPADPTQDLIRFEVADTGVGLEPDQLEKIFQPFEQVGDRTRQAEGTGLGLPISRQLVRAMGGELHVESQPGQGSVFWFEAFLRIVEVDADVKQRQARTIIGYKGRRRKALVVDDKDYNRSVMVNFLEPLGFEIVSTVDGRQAIAQAQAERPDIIFMDMIMPVMMGFEAAQQIRRIPEIKRTVIIGASASVFEKDRRQVKLAGCDDFLAKPVNFGALTELLETHLRLEWLYDDKQEGDRREGDWETGRPEGQASLADEIENPATGAPAKSRHRHASEIQNPIPPPAEELAVLFEMVMRGNMTGIRDRAVALEQVDQKYKPFTDKLQQLVKTYDDDAVLALIKQCKEAYQ